MSWNISFHSGIHKGSPDSHLQEARQGAKTFHHLFLSPPSSTPQDIFQTFQSALRCWLVHQLHQLSGMISAAFPPTFNEIRESGMSFTQWVLLLNSGNQSKHQEFASSPKEGMGWLPYGSKNVFSGETSTEKSSFQGCSRDKQRRLHQGRDQRRERLAGSHTNSGNLNVSDYQRWFTSVHFAPSIVKDIAFICIDSLFHNMSLRYRYYYDDGNAWTSKTLTPAGERLQRILVNPDKSGNVIKNSTLLLLY